MIKFKKKDKPIRDELSDIYEFLDNIMNDQKQIKDKIKKIYLDPVLTQKQLITTLHLKTAIVAFPSWRSRNESD